MLGPSLYYTTSICLLGKTIFGEPKPILESLVSGTAASLLTYLLYKLLNRLLKSKGDARGD